MKLKKLIAGLNILLKYNEDAQIFGTDEDAVIVFNIDPATVSEEDKALLDSLFIYVSTKKELENYYVYDFEYESAFVFFIGV